MLMKNDSLSRYMCHVNKYLGWRNWSVLVYNSFIENIFVVFYIALREMPHPFQFILDFFSFLIFSSLCTTYGYLVNDLGDRELDRLQGKSNTFEYDSNEKAALVVLFFLFSSILFGQPFFEKKICLMLWICWLVITTFYSLKPIRLKERGKAGLILVVAAQRVLPVLILFTAFNYYDSLDWIIITAYICFRGFSSDVNHQLEDYHRDTATETKTYAVQVGLQKGWSFLRFCLQCEKLLLLLCLLLMTSKLNKIWGVSIYPLVPLLALYSLLYIKNIKKIRFNEPPIDVNPFLSGRKDLFQFLHHGFPSVLLPLYLILLLLLHHWSFSFILLAFIFLRRLYSLDAIKESYPWKLLDGFIMQ